MSAFLLRFKANYCKELRGYPNFSLWIPIPCKDLLFHMVLSWHKNLSYLVGTILKEQVEYGELVLHSQKVGSNIFKKHENPKGEYNLSLQVVLFFHCLEQYLTQPLSLCLVSDLMHRPSFQLAWGEKH